MSLKQYLSAMSAGAFICWIAWAFVILTMDPKQADAMGFIFFYFSLFLALCGTFAVIGFLIRRHTLSNDEILFRHVRRTFKQGIIIAGMIIIGLLLAQFKLLTWWNTIILATLYITVEFLAFTNRKYKV